MQHVDHGRQLVGVDEARELRRVEHALLHLQQLGRQHPPASCPSLPGHAGRRGRVALAPVPARLTPKQAAGRSWVGLVLAAA